MASANQIELDWGGHAARISVLHTSEGGFAGFGAAGIDGQLVRYPGLPWQGRLEAPMALTTPASKPRALRRRRRDRPRRSSSFSVSTVAGGSVAASAT